MEGDNVVRAFSESHVERLTGLSKGQLRYWDKTGFFSPRYGYENRRSPYSRVYSFRDVVGLKTLAILRKDYRVSLQHLRQAASELSRLRDDLWAGTTLYVADRKVYFKEPDTGRIRGAVDR
ncbi:MAG TPA: MerR family transcriptional regulator, partial [Alphaproteobacteria bacterium]